MKVSPGHGIDYRRLQRTLFRMQLDPAFAAAVMAGKGPDSGLGEAERELLKRAGITGILADSGGRRRAQILGNIGSEFVLTLAEAARAGVGVDVLHEFPGSQAFHAAILAEQALPLALGTWLRAKLRASTDGVAGALAVVEDTMARARRALRPAPPRAPAAGEVALSNSAWLVTLPAGTFDHAQASRAALDAGEPAPAPGRQLATRAASWLGGLGAAGEAADGAAEADGGDSPIVEVVLLVASIEQEDHRLREVAAERLERDVALLLQAATTPFGDAALSTLAAARGWSRSDVDECVTQLVADGVLVRR